MKGLRHAGKLPYRLDKTLPRMSTNLFNVFNIWSRSLGPKRSFQDFGKSRLTVFQMMWKAKKLTRSYWGVHLGEKVFKRWWLPHSLPPTTRPFGNPKAIALAHWASPGAEGGRQFQNALAEKEALTGNTPLTSMMFREIERRLDTVVFRALLAPDIGEARRLVLHGHVLLNGRKEQQPHVRLVPGDLIEVNPEYMKWLKPPPALQIEWLKNEMNFKFESNQIQWTDSDHPPEYIKSPHGVWHHPDNPPKSDGKVYPSWFMEKEPGVWVSPNSVKNEAGGYRHATEEEREAMKAAGTWVTLPKATHIVAEVEEGEESASEEAALDEAEEDEGASVKNPKKQTFTRYPKTPTHIPARPHNPAGTKDFHIPPFAAPALFVPPYILPNYNACAAVYIRHPTARPFYSEIPSPYEADGQLLGLAWRYYTARRRRQRINRRMSEDPWGPDVGFRGRKRVHPESRGRTGVSKPFY